MSGRPSARCDSLGVVLDAVMGKRLRAVERFAWHMDDGSPTRREVGSAHLWFEDGRCVHLDARSDWSLAWSVSEPGDDTWLAPYAYEFHGRWVIREASDEPPFAEVVGTRLTEATPLSNEVHEVVGVRLHFEGATVSLSTWAGEISTAPR